MQKKMAGRAIYDFQILPARFGIFSGTYIVINTINHSKEKIIELVQCGCLNSAGFYNADIAAIVGGVTEYFSGIA